MNYNAIDFILCDAHGIARGKQAPAHHLQSYAQKGFGFPRSVLGMDVYGSDVLDNGLLEEGDGDVIARAISEDIVPVTWARNRAQIQTMMYERDGAPCLYDSRQILVQAAKQFYEKYHYKPVMAFELEFYLGTPSKSHLRCFERMARSQSTLPMQSTNAYLMQDLVECNALFDDIYAACEAQKIPADALVSENSPSQYEINFHHVDDSLLAADHAFLFKRIVKAVAEQHDMTATFMPKPFADAAGSGMHIHLSLLDEKGNDLFQLKEHNPNQHLSNALAGMAATMPDSTLIFAPHANSYKRLRPDSYAPLSATWGIENRTTALRIPYSETENCRIEHRVAGADANPYLVATTLLAALDYGFSHNLQVAPVTLGDGYQDDSAPQIHTNWYGAHQAFAQSEFMRKALGLQFHTMFERVINQEILKMQTQISDIEHMSYFRSL